MYAKPSVSALSILNTVLGTWATSVNQKHKNIWSHGAYILLAEIKKINRTDDDNY